MTTYTLTKRHRSRKTYADFDSEATARKAVLGLTVSVFLRSCLTITDHGAAHRRNLTGDDLLKWAREQSR